MKYYQALATILLCGALLATDPRPAHGEPDLSALLEILAAMPEGSWARVNLNRFDEVATPPELRPLIRGHDSHPYKIISAWGGMAWDPHRGDLILFGGGHGDYAGNEVYRWRATTRRWERASLPSAMVEDCLGYWQPVDGPDHAPVSAHTYDNNVFLSIVDRFVSFGGAATLHGGPYYRDVDCDHTRLTGPYFFDPDRAHPDRVGGSDGSHVQREGAFPQIQGGLMWENRDIPATLPDAPFPHRFVDGASDVIQENGRDVVYVSAFSGGTATALYKYTVNSLDDPTLDTWEQVGRYWNALSGEGSGAYLPSLHAFVRIAGGDIGYWDLSTAGPKNDSVVFTPADPEDSYEISSDHGLIHDPVRQRLLIWSGEAAVWALIPPAELGVGGWVIEPQPTPGGSAPGSGTGTGVLGKWTYVPDLDAFLGIQAVDAREGAVWLYKPVDWRDPGVDSR
jgi:hypothetical protein